MRIAVVLPQFRHDAEPALDVARRAEAAGIDGIFVFDHLWPLGHPERPALHSTTLLGAVVAETSFATMGTLVARVGLVPNAVLVHTFVTLRRMAGPRLIAGLGTGDRANRAENQAYGLDFPPVADRLAALIACSRELRTAGIPTWIGGRSPAVHRAAAEADGWNGWGMDAATFAEEVVEVRQAASIDGAEVEVTWGGQVLVARDQAEVVDKLARIGDRPGLVCGTVDDVAAHFGALADAGATWAVCSALDIADDPAVVDHLVRAGEGLR